MLLSKSADGKLESEIVIVSELTRGEIENRKVSIISTIAAREKLLQESVKDLAEVDIMLDTCDKLGIK